MKKVLLIIGIVLIVIAVFAFALALLWHFAAANTMDGTAEMYYRQIRMMWLYLAVGVAATISGVICLIFRKRY